MTAQRNAAEATMNSFWTLYEAGRFQDSVNVLHALDYPAEVVDFTLNPDSYYFPNQRGSDFIRPTSVSDDLIPIVALEENRAYHFERPALHRLQKIALERSGFSELAIQKTARGFAAYNDVITSSGGGHGSASNYFKLLPTDKPNTYIESKPVLTFNIDPSVKDPENEHTGVVIHEFTHLVQTLTDPIREVSDHDDLREELEAYAVHAALVKSYAVPYTLATAMAGTVDIFRRKYLGENEFDPTPEFIEAFKQHDILGRVLAAKH